MVLRGQTPYINIKNKSIIDNIETCIKKRVTHHLHDPYPCHEH